MKKIISILLMIALTVSFTAVFSAAVSPSEQPAEGTETEERAEAPDNGKNVKAIAAAVVVGIAAAASAVCMAIAIASSVGAMARQPEASSKINSAMLLGLVFIETAIIYALIVAILIIFVL